MPEPSGRRQALLIGITYPDTDIELKNSAADLASMRGTLFRLGFPAEWTLCLSDQDDASSPQAFQPTFRNILAAMRWLTSGVVSGDVLFFHFSGHGAQQEDPKCGDVLDDGLCPVDFTQSGLITDDMIFELLVRHLPAGVRLTALIDCCNPGSCMNLPFSCSPELGWVEEPNPWHTLGDVILLHARSESATPVGASQPSGVVTTTFLQAMREIAERRRGPVTYLELVSQILEIMRGHELRPCLSASQAFDPTARTFRFFDAVPNGNQDLGPLFPERKKRSRPRMLLPEGLSAWIPLGRSGNIG